MKSPPVQYTDDEARKMVEDFITASAPVDVIAKKSRKQEVTK
jgi:hypothetical protein